MSITITSAKLNTAGNATLSKDEAVKELEEQIKSALSVFDIQYDAFAVLSTEGKPTDTVQKCEIKVVTKNGTIIAEGHSRSIQKAINRAIPDLERQMRKIKTRKIDKGRERARNAKERSQEAAAAEFDAIEEDE